MQDQLECDKNMWNSKLIIVFIFSVGSSEVKFAWKTFCNSLS